MSAAAWRSLRQRPALTISDLRRLTQIGGTLSSRCLSVQEEMIEAKAPLRRRSMLPPISSSGGQAFPCGFLNPMPFPSNFRHRHFFGTSSRSLSDSTGCWRQKAVCKRRISSVLQSQPDSSIPADQHGNGRPRSITFTWYLTTKLEDSVSIRKLDMDATWTPPVLPHYLPSRYDAAIAVRNSFRNDVLVLGGLHCLIENPSDDDDDDEVNWTWQPLFGSSPFSWSWTDGPPEFPFDASTIRAYVVHPRTGTILVSAQGYTFSYGTRGGGQWKCRGDWMLPFKGPAHYDHQLDAWVGLNRASVYPDYAADGYLCACPVMSGWQPPKWQVGKEKLFLEDSHWRHVDAKLGYMRELGMYCFVERLLPEGADKSMCVFRLTTFVVKYGEDGELITMTQWPPRFYKAPIYRPSSFDVQAFWM